MLEPKFEVYVKNHLNAMIKNMESYDENDQTFYIFIELVKWNKNNSLLKWK